MPKITSMLKMSKNLFLRDNILYFYLYLYQTIKGNLKVNLFLGIHSTIYMSLVNNLQIDALCQHLFTFFEGPTFSRQHTSVRQCA